MTPGSSEEAERASVGVLLHEREDVGEREVAFPGDARGLDPGVGRGDVRVEARPGGRHRLDGNRRAGRETVLVPVGDDPRATSLMSVGFEGPRFEAELDVPSYPSPAAEGRGWKYFAAVKVCPIRLEPTTMPSRLTSEPFALAENPSCEMPVIASG